MKVISQVRLYERFGSVLRGEQSWRRKDSVAGYTTMNCRRELHDLGIDASLMCDWQIYALTCWAADVFDDSHVERLAQILGNDCSM